MRKGFLCDDTAASSAEYGLLLVVVGIGITFGAAKLGDSISEALENSAA